MLWVSRRQQLLMDTLRCYRPWLVSRLMTSSAQLAARLQADRPTERLVSAGSSESMAMGQQPWLALLSPRWAHPSAPVPGQQQR